MQSNNMIRMIGEYKNLMVVAEIRSHDFDNPVMKTKWKNAQDLYMDQYNKLTSEEKQEFSIGVNSGLYR